VYLNLTLNQYIAARRRRKMINAFHECIISFRVAQVKKADEAIREEISFKAALELTVLKVQRVLLAIQEELVTLVGLDLMA
jgi:hypothetical protein